MMYTEVAAGSIQGTEGRCLMGSEQVLGTPPLRAAAFLIALQWDCTAADYRLLRSSVIPASKH